MLISQEHFYFVIALWRGKMADMSMSAEGKEMIDTLSKLDRIKDIRNRTIQVL